MISYSNLDAINYFTNKIKYQDTVTQYNGTIHACMPHTLLNFSFKIFKIEFITNVYLFMCMILLCYGYVCDSN